MTVLVTGIAGGLARTVARMLRNDGVDVVGVDYRPVDEASAGVPVVRASYNKTAIEAVFKQHRFESVLHLGRIGNLANDMEQRFELNVLGSQKLFSLALQSGVKNVVVLSTFHVYGAQAKNPTPISEDDPLRAGPDFPEIADAIQLDAMASAWAYRHRGVRTVVLRPTNIIGPTVQNTLCRLLRLSRVPYLAGFNPMMQFIHEDDLASAIVAAMRGAPVGVFNVAGPDVIPWRTALAYARVSTLPVPASLTKIAMRVASPFPAYLVNFFKYPCVVDDGAFRRAFSWSPRVDLRTALEQTVSGARARDGVDGVT